MVVMSHFLLFCNPALSPDIPSLSALDLAPWQSISLVCTRPGWFPSLSAHSHTPHHWFPTLSLFRVCSSFPDLAHIKFLFEILFVLHIWLFPSCAKKAELLLAHVFIHQLAYSANLLGERLINKCLRNMGYVHSDLDFAFDGLFLLLIVWFSSASSLLHIIWTRDPALLLFCILLPPQLICVLLWWPWTLKQNRLFCHIFTNCQGSCLHTYETMNAFQSLEELTLSLFLPLNKEHLICVYTVEWTGQKKMVIAVR